MFMPIISYLTISIQNHFNVNHSEANQFDTTNFDTSQVVTDHFNTIFFGINQ